MLRVNFLIFFVICITFNAHGQLNTNSFPTEFLFGTATASYQIEGAWNTSGKGENIWDRFTHERPEFILDGSNGDIACDSYHKYEEDVALMKAMGVQFYRFSLSWSRILPKGLSYKINSDGIRYYNALIEKLLENNIIPMITLFHWDTPQPLEDLGGFTSDLMVDWFEEYARIAFEEFGDRVKLWLTFNEPKQTCLNGIGKTVLAPAYNSEGIGDYLCAHNILKAHARAYHVYNDEYKPKQKGKVGIAIDTFWFVPESESKADIDAAQRAIDFEFGWYADPIFHPNGDYPKSMKENIARRSKAEGFLRSRLPTFTEVEVKYIQGTYDFFALNHYTSLMAADTAEAPIDDPSFEKDVKVRKYQHPDWPTSASSWLTVVPWGFRKILSYIKNRYGDIEIHITENGYSDKEGLNDLERIDYYKQYLSALLDSIHEDKVKVVSYAAWSLMDNFEWVHGYTNRFGLHHVDFKDPERKRTPKSSALYYKEVLANRKLPTTDDGDGVGKTGSASLFSVTFIACIVYWISRS